MSERRYTFRTLAGISEVEALEAKINEHPNPEWAPEQDLLGPLVDRISRKLFGIARADTDLVNDDFDSPDWEKQQERWQQNFYFAEYDFSGELDQTVSDKTELQIWELLGWDVTDSRGQIHECLWHFQRQMICATKRLRGRLPDQERSEVELTQDAEEWGRALMRPSAGPRSTRKSR